MKCQIISCNNEAKHNVVTKACGFEIILGVCDDHVKAANFANIRRQHIENRFCSYLPFDCSKEHGHVPWCPTYVR